MKTEGTFTSHAIRRPGNITGKVNIPASSAEIMRLGWDHYDILLITGDAYIDHPSFGVPLLARLLAETGYRVAICSRPSWPGMPRGTRHVSADAAVSELSAFGKPRLFVGIGSGVVDSMLNNYTANKKKRSEDDYAPAAQGNTRPDNAVATYASLARKTFGDITIVAGGIEATMRRLAHYDYWSNSIRPSLLISSDCDYLVYGMGERQVLLIAKAISGYPDDRETSHSLITRERGICYLDSRENARSIENRLLLPSLSEIRKEKKKLSRAYQLYEKELNPYNAKPVVQYHGNKAVVLTPPPLPLKTGEFDHLHEMSFSRKPHPMYKGKRIPAFETIRFSIISTRGCFSGCSFCSLSQHQGRFVQSRSTVSIIKEIEKLIKSDGFTGYISDIGGPTANMYMLGCRDDKSRTGCRKYSCLHPAICTNLDTDHGKQIAMLKKVSMIPGIKGVFIASGIRHDLALMDKRYVELLVSKHVGGHLKLAPEHCSSSVLDLMRKPPFSKFEEFSEFFRRFSARAGKQQYIVPYFISAHPGSTTTEMQEISDWLASENRKLQQVQAFIPLPMTLSSVMFYSGMDTRTGKGIPVAKSEKDRRRQHELLQPHRNRNKIRTKRHRKPGKKT